MGIKLSERIRKERFRGGCAERAKDWADKAAQLEEENANLKRDKRDLNEWLSVEFPRAFEALQTKVLNPDALLTEEVT